MVLFIIRQKSADMALGLLNTYAQVLWPKISSILGKVIWPKDPEIPEWEQALQKTHGLQRR